MKNKGTLVYVMLTDFQILISMKYKLSLSYDHVGILVVGKILQNNIGVTVF